jgi:hypothetical protein
MNDYFVAASWLAIALTASLVSVRIRVSVALIEILVGLCSATSRVCASTSSRPRSRHSWQHWARCC